MNTPTKDLKLLQHYEPYYLNGGDLHMIAENWLFRVHRYFFERESAHFRLLLARPVEPGKEPQGTSDLKPIMLPDVKAKELEKFLWVFYNPKYSLYDASIEDWTTILKLAHEWDFGEVKSLALRQLEGLEMPIVDRIVVYQAYKAGKEVLMSRFVELCARTETITEEEASRLETKTLVQVCRIREIIRSRSSDGSKSPLPPDLDMKDVRTTIQKLLSGTKPQTPKPTTNNTTTSNGRTGASGASAH